MKRIKLKGARRKRVSLYFKGEKPTSFISSGCTLLDCALGGGWPLGRIINIVGDKSTGKTLLVIEAMANMLQKYPEAELYYHEGEGAFDKGYAATLGMPLSKVTFPFDDDDKGDTVEDFFKEVNRIADARIAKGVDSNRPCLYALDSLDSLTDEAEKKREIDDGTYGTKAKQLSQSFRRLVKKCNRAGMMIIIISQIRDKLNVTFGRKVTRSGGRALDFYASLVVYLAEIGKIKRTVRGIERPVAIRVRVKVDKSKVGMPFRECDVPIVFSYGIESVQAGVEWLVSVKATQVLKELGLPAKPDIRSLRRVLSDSTFEADLNKAVRRLWRQIEKDFAPGRRKYG